MKAKKLVLENSNNSLSLDTFIQINLAPPRQRMPDYEKISDQLFSVTHNHQEFFVRLIEIWFLKFSEICSIETQIVSGMFALEWRTHFQKQHPEVTDETMDGDLLL